MKKVKKSKNCKFCKNLITVEVVDMGHDINIQDTEHEDNFITITHAEAEFVLMELRKILE